jgi:all-trans-retinol 13,14-reductase
VGRAFGESYKRYSGGDRYDAIVVGSGIGGLTCAVLLAKHGGKRVLVLEKHYVAGGFTHTFNRPGYEWDVGLHYIGDVGRNDLPTHRLFDEITGGRLQWAAMPDVYDRIIIGDQSFDFVKGEERFREQLKHCFPAEATAIDAYLARLQETVDAIGLFSAEKIVPRPIAFLFGGWMRRKFLRHARRTTRETLEELTSDQQLIAVLTGQYGNYGLPPSQSSFGIHALVAKHYMDGGYYPVGGASAIAAGAVPEIEDRGGKVLVGAGVESIHLEGRRAVGVTMEDGRIFRAPLVISNAGASNTFGRLLPDANDAVDGSRQLVEKLGGSVAHLGLYVGLNHSDEELGLEGTNLWIHPDEHHDANLSRFLADPDAPIPFTYVSFPSCKDPSFRDRHPGRATIDVISFASYERFADWQDEPWRKRGTDYEALKEDFAQRLLAVLHEHVPQVKGKIDTYELSSPLSTRTFANWPGGAIYGLNHTPARFLQRALGPRTPIHGLYLTGQDASTCGVAGAMVGGALAASVALGRPVIQRLLKGAGP